MEYDNALPEPADFPTNLSARALRACKLCRLIKTYDQFFQTGCENCIFLQIAGDRNMIDEVTTGQFEGMLNVMDPAGSWAAKWHHVARSRPGCYALSAPDDLPPSIEDMLPQDLVRRRQSIARVTAPRRPVGGSRKGGHRRGRQSSVRALDKYDAADDDFIDDD